ncbi:MAG: N-acetylmuramidase domain-containing protein, partial [Terriglobia bacterium]
YTWPYIDGVMKERFSDKQIAALAISKASRLNRVRTETAALFPGSMQPGMTALAAAAAGPFYKDDPVLAGTRLEPDFVYKLPAGDGPLKRMAQTYNAIGGLVETFARRLDIDPVAVLAVWYVESGGRTFTPGKPVLRFENHKFFKYWGVEHEALFDKHFQFGGHAGIPGASHKNHRFRNKPTDAWRPVHIESQDREYEVFALAESLGGREAACMSASFGGPQIMGFNHGACGYPLAAAMVEAFGADQRWQVLGFYDFCKSNGLIDEIRNKQWVAFGDRYNGDGAVYGPKLKAAFDTKQALLGLPKLPNPQAEMVAVLAVRERTPVKPKRAARKSKRAAAKTRRGAKKSGRRASPKSKRAGGSNRATTRTTRASTRARRSRRRAA